MPSFSLAKNELTYAASDLNAIDRVIALLRFAAEFDHKVQQDAASAKTYLTHVRDHVAKQRTGTPAKGAGEGK